MNHVPRPAGDSAAAGRPVLVLGATGGQGAAVVSALRPTGVIIRALARDPDSGPARALARSGVEVRPGLLNDTSTLEEAMSGASAVFGLTTPFERGPDAEIEQGMAILGAAERTEVPYLVYSSVASALDHTAVPHFDSKAVIERELARRDIPSAVVAPSYFFDNLSGQLASLASGRIALPLAPDRPIQQVDRRTFGQIAAAILLSPSRWAGQRVEIAAEALTGSQMAATLTRLMSRPITYVRQALTEAQARSDIGAMWAFLARDGYRVDIAALKAAFPRVDWVGFTEWADASLHPGGHEHDAREPQP